ncbi:hypothetical protein BDP27DRAFT_1322205 [Rhodocollybia butyracea]|uniref:Uncharacterized protein n=1 Tax=Rhodocollybia butyracea TaxID=206335 RepID=A0A9P5UAV6_9AGAR|nr:hypothetical protein BDP27DRAFT_1322205 [Rhodocollybia butyracea]
MATVSIDVSRVIGDIRETILVIKDERKAAKEKLNNAELLVYKALALHPALEHMHPPTGSMGDMDWYTELGTRWSFGIFQKLGQHRHFKKTALLGNAGSRARIMMLLLWILGNRLAEDQIGRMLSAAVSDGLQAVEPNTEPTNTFADELLHLDSMKQVLIDLRRMIKTKLPLPPDRNPFLGRDYRAKDEDESIPRSELWGYELSEDQRYELDIKRNPVVLLRPLPNKIIIPQTKLTLLLIHWATCNFGLGKKVHSKDEIDSTLFWNADPPKAVYPNLPPYQAHSLPLDEWIHLRFCEVYDVHEWAHDGFMRVLLLNNFSAVLTPEKQRFPSPSDIQDVHGVARWLRQRLNDDICLNMERFILQHAVALWFDNSGVVWSNVTGLTVGPPWHIEEWSAEERGLTVIFTDAVINNRKDENGFPEFDGIYKPESWFNMQLFFQDPARFVPDAADILALPLLRDAANLEIVSESKFRSDECVCGQCRDVYEQMLNNLEWFRIHYFTVTDRALAERNCNALRNSWEPTLTHAEEWYEEVLAHIESPYPVLPELSELPRVGPLILEVADSLDIKIGTNLVPSSLLRFLVVLHITDSENTVPYHDPLPSNALGKVIAVRLIEDREEYLTGGQDPDYAMEYVLCAIGDWMYQLAGSDGLAIIYTDDNFAIEHSLDLLKWRTVVMSDFKPDFPGRFPLRHTEHSERIPVIAASDVEDFNDRIEIVLSDLESDGFPFLSLPQDRTPDVVAALLRVQCLGRTVESVWKPKVRIGHPCDHTQNHQVMMCCSPTAIEVIKLVEPSEKCDISSSVASTEELRTRLGPQTTRKTFEPEWKDALKRRMEEYSSRTAQLVQRSDLLEPNNICIVRCGPVEGPVNAMIILATSLRKHVYMIHRNECWDCALLRMDELQCTLGIALYTKYITRCSQCR